LEQQCSYSEIFQIPDCYLQEVFDDAEGTKARADAERTSYENGVAEDTAPTVSSMNGETNVIDLDTYPSEDTLRTSNTKTTSSSVKMKQGVSDQRVVIDTKVARRNSRGLFNTSTLRQSIAEGSSFNTVSTGKSQTTATRHSLFTAVESHLDVTDLTAIASRDDDVEHVIYLGSKP
jgi:hypothetical protein